MGWLDNMGDTNGSPAMTDIMGSPDYIDQSFAPAMTDIMGSPDYVDTSWYDDTDWGDWGV
jgi:hypothetical protein